MNDREELIGFINDLEKEVYACIDSANKEKANDVFGQIKDNKRGNRHHRKNKNAFILIRLILVSSYNSSQTK